MKTKLTGARVTMTTALKAAAGAALLWSLTPGVLLAGTIVGSAHDFQGKGWSGGEICVACHTPHNSDTTVAEAPLWNHELTVATFTPYTSTTGTLDATVGQPDGTSKLCLSCHDGTVALDSFGGATGATTIGGGKNLGTDLTNDHPISMTFDAALATTDGTLFDPTVKTVTIGEGTQSKTGTLAAVMLSANKVQCTSCHDVHNTNTVAGNPGKPLLKVSKTGSALCLACHNK